MASNFMRLRPGGRAQRWLRHMPNAYSTIELVLIAGLAVQGARLVWAIATPVTPLGSWRPAAGALPGSPFDILTGFDPFFRLDADAPGGPVTSLRLTLFGTRIDEAMGGGSAIVAGPDGIQRSVAVGQEALPGVRLKAVAFDHVTLDRGGRAEDLFLDQSGAHPAPATAAGAVPPPLAGPGGIAAEVDAVPRLEGGRISGLVLHPRGSGALMARAGLRDGDVLTAVGGRPITSPADLEQIAGSATGGSVTAVVERGGQTLPVTIPLGGGR